jgi:hypothetical protein
MRQISGRTRLPRAAVLAAALATTALLATACGRGGSSGATGASADQTAYQKAIAYAQCMRSHREVGFPDPDSQGDFDIPASIDAGSPQYLAANRACAHLDPVAPLTAPQQRQLTVDALRFAACIRTHGIPNFPDPVVTAHGMKINGIGPAPSAPQLAAAQQACRKFLPGGGS